MKDGEKLLGNIAEQCVIKKKLLSLKRNLDYEQYVKRKSNSLNKTNNVKVCRNGAWLTGRTSSNKRYTLRRLFGGSGLRSARSFRYATFPRLTPPTFLQPWSCYASPYSGCKNVVYLERYAKCQPKYLCKY